MTVREHQPTLCLKWLLSLLFTFLVFTFRFVLKEVTGSWGRLLALEPFKRDGANVRLGFVSGVQPRVQ